jgi:hypothetical protein
MNLALYHAAKRFHMAVEAVGVLSVHVLQANILTAIYEMGHAIYPAAYISVGTCARYGLALGIDKCVTGPPCESEWARFWVEIEEKRRAWWAIILLDR